MAHRTLPLVLSLLAFLAPFLWATSASAGLWQVETTYSLSNFGSPAPIGSAVGVATVNGSAGGSHLSALSVPGGLVSIQSTSTPTATTTTPPFTKVIISMTPGAGTFNGGAGTGTLRGSLPVPGNVRVCLFGNCLFAVDVPFTQNGTRGVGLGGTVMAPLPGGTITLVGATWAAATATVNGSTGPMTTPGFAHGPLSMTSSTIATDGVVQLVTPVQILFDSGTPPALPLGLFGTLNVRFVPEPASFVGLVAGATLLLLLGVRRS